MSRFNIFLQNISRFRMTRCASWWPRPLAWSKFRRYFISSGLCYAFFLLMTLLFKPYEYFPGLSFIAYAIIVGFLLMALSHATSKHHYLLVSAALIVFGAIASFDMVLSRDEAANLWVHWDLIPMTHAHVEGYMQILIILLNIFTGSLAANSLFYGLNKRNFS